MSFADVSGPTVVTEGSMPVTLKESTLNELGPDVEPEPDPDPDEELGGPACVLLPLLLWSGICPENEVLCSVRVAVAAETPAVFSTLVSQLALYDSSPIAVRSWLCESRRWPLPSATPEDLARWEPAWRRPRACAR